jgi:succinoglycan biosynthesis transport protein ExoP
MLSPEARSGLAEIVRGKAALDDAIWTDIHTKMSFLPAAYNNEIHHPDEIFASDRMQSLIEELRRRYDYIVLDLPPITPFADIRALTRVVDSLVYIIEWGVTNRDAVQSALRAAIGVREKLLGCLLNKADMTKLSRYYRHEASDYYTRYRAHHGRKPRV